MEKNEEITEQSKDFAHPKNKQVDFDDRDDMEHRRDSLAVRLRAGDRTAAAELVDKYYKLIYLFMRGLGHSSQVSEDLTQETFLRAWYHIGQLRDGRALNGWIYRIAGNVSRLYWRRNKNKETVGIESIEIFANDDTTEEKAGHKEQLGRLREAIGCLSWKLRQAIVLHYLHHMTISEAAEAAGIREGTFKSRLNRALRILRGEISE